LPRGSLFEEELAEYCPLARSRCRRGGETQYPLSAAERREFQQERKKTRKLAGVMSSYTKLFTSSPL